MLVLALVPAKATHAVPTDPAMEDANHLDVLDFHGTPRGIKDRSFNIFFDAGAWHGYSLPASGDGATGFSGPFVHSLQGGVWAGTQFAQMRLEDADNGQAMVLTPVDDHSGPGYLERHAVAPGLDVRQTLFYADSRTAVVKIELAASAARAIRLSIEGATKPLAGSRLEVWGADVVQHFAGSPSRLITRLRGDGEAITWASVNERRYRIGVGSALSLRPGESATIFVEQMLTDDPKGGMPASVDDREAWKRNRERWQAYLKPVQASHLSGVPDEVAQRVLLKAVTTLLGNWPAARGDLHHDGVMPSYSNPDANGFWTWGSGKHAAALAHFAPARKACSSPGNPSRRVGGVAGRLEGGGRAAG
ncbi:hypothetical protein [Dyella solisilvae]|uniref:hypothetical protein n=1 Tax=Dyella solisilvae TaxID=1920168 RepID=UPI0011C01D07|nr:hypothetical protein [Dyella solisilvae]